MERKKESKKERKRRRSVEVQIRIEECRGRREEWKWVKNPE